MKALIYIPDISGFTKFVTQTEVEHSNHIIKELLEVIISNNSLGMTISEIEGDAVLFYKKGDPPKIEDVFEQTKRMFTSFHNYLRIIERNRVCRCGACSTAYKLTLKFIVHFGELNEVKVHNFNNIMGKDVILAHRLLKANIKDREHLICTENYFKTQNFENKYNDWVSFVEYEEEIENFGVVKTKFTSLTGLHKFVSEFEDGNRNKAVNVEPDLYIFIKAPVPFVHEKLIDNAGKINWVTGIKEVKNEPPINRIGAKHTCAFGNFELDFETESDFGKNDSIYYSERVKTSDYITLVMQYKLDAFNGGTNLSLSFIPANIYDNSKNKINFIIKIKTFLTDRSLKNNMKRSLGKFKYYCESSYREYAELK